MFGKLLDLEFINFRSYVGGVKMPNLSLKIIAAKTLKAMFSDDQFNMTGILSKDLAALSPEKSIFITDICKEYLNKVTEPQDIINITNLFLNKANNNSMSTYILFSFLAERALAKKYKLNNELHTFFYNMLHNLNADDYLMLENDLAHMRDGYGGRNVVEWLIGESSLEER